MANLLLSSIVAFLLLSCEQSQNESAHGIELIGNCEGCEAVLEYGDKAPGPADTLPDFHEEETQIKVTGTIYQEDGTTPAEGAVLYVYHTNQDGIYATRGDETGWGKRHGYIRGWVKTGSDGRYTFYTLKPGVYPSGSEPAHIHPIILEPDGKYYWLESYYFAGDTLLSERELNPPSPRGGTTGVLELKPEGDLLVGHRDIVLGKNVPGYED